MNTYFHHPELNSETIERIISDTLTQQDRVIADPNERADQGLFAIWFDNSNNRYCYFVGNKHDPLGALNAYLVGMAGLGLVVLHVREIKPCKSLYTVLYVPEGEESIEGRWEWAQVWAVDQDDAEEWAKRNVLDLDSVMWATTDIRPIEDIMRDARKTVLGERSA